jgi:hypothetical protein
MKSPFAILVVVLAVAYVAHWGYRRVTDPPRSAGVENVLENPNHPKPPPRLPSDGPALVIACDRTIQDKDLYDFLVNQIPLYAKQLTYGKGGALSIWTYDHVPRSVFETNVYVDPEDESFRDLLRKEFPAQPPANRAQMAQPGALLQGINRELRERLKHRNPVVLVILTDGKAESLEDKHMAMLEAAEFQTRNPNATVIVSGLGSNETKYWQGIFRNASNRLILCPPETPDLGTDACYNALWKS